MDVKYMRSKHKLYAIPLVSIAIIFMTISIASAAQYAYITNYANGTVSVIDTETKNVTATMNVGSGPFGVAVTTDGTKVYVANKGDGTVSVIDAASNTVTATVNVGNEPIGIAVSPDGKKVYVTNTNINTVSVIDTATNTVISNVNVGNHPLGIVVSPDGTKAYTANYGSRNVSVINTATNVVTDTVQVGNIPVGITINSAGTNLYVTNHGSNNISVIDTATDNVTATINVGHGPVGVAVNLAETQVYVANMVSDDIYVIDAITNSVTAKVPIGNMPMGIAVKPDGENVYVANTGSDTVSVIDTATQTVTSTINVGSGPTAFGQFTVNPQVPAGPNLYLSKNAPTYISNQTLLSYDLYYQNLGNQNAEDVVLTDTLPENTSYKSASDSGVYNLSTGMITWNIGSVAPGSSGYRTLAVNIPQNVSVGTVIINNAHISTSSHDVSLNNNQTQTYTTITTNNLPPNVTIEPNNGTTGPKGQLSAFWKSPITFGYTSCSAATEIDINIHFDDGLDIVEKIPVAPSNRSYTFTPYPHSGLGTITYKVHGCGNPTLIFNIYIDPAGFIYDVNTGNRIAGASVWLQQPDGTGNWENVSIGDPIPIAKPDVNPLVTNADGQYQWDVLNGTYRVHVTAPGYYPANSIVVSVPPPVEDLHVGLVPNEVPTPALTITKTPNPLTYTDGQSVTYTYLITNIGNVTLSNIGVVDNLAGTITNLNVITLAPGQQATGTGSYVTTQSDYANGSVTNTATVYNGSTALNQTTAKVTATQPNWNPALTITKTPNPLTYSASGQTITYTYTVKNTGNAEIKGPITVTDDKFGTITIPNSDTLSKGSSVTGTATYKITDADINAGHVTNFAFATGSFNSASVISPNAIAIVSYEQPTKKEEHDEEEHNEEEHNGDRDNYGGPGYGDYGGAVIPMIPGPMSSSPMFSSEPNGYGSEPNVYTSGPSTTEIQNSESNVHKTKAHLSKHKHKHKHHTTKHHKTGKKHVALK
jgi:uncharacterized repeat protein (TIGR01451 family)